MNSARQQGTERNLMTYIKTLSDTFTKSEKKLVGFIVENPEKVIYSSLAELSDAIGVGEATIVRFCRKVDCDGFYAFKMNLAKSLQPGQQSPMNEAIPSIDQSTNVPAMVARYVQQSVSETQAALDYEKVKQVAGLVAAARNVKVYGIGASATAALDAKHHYKRIGIPIDCFTDGHGMAIDAAVSCPDDLIIGISYSGETIDMVEAFKVAKKNGVKTVAVTHFPRSYLAKYADFVLLTGAKGGPLQGGAVHTKIAQLMVMEILFCQLYLTDSERYTKIRNQTSESIANKIR